MSSQTSGHPFDLQAIIPAELALVEGRRVTMLRRTKTSGPNRRVRELPVAISEHAFFVKSGWLKVGFDLLKQHANYKRDYLMRRRGPGAEAGWQSLHGSRGHPRPNRPRL